MYKEMMDTIGLVNSVDRKWARPWAGSWPASGKTSS